MGKTLDYAFIIYGVLNFVGTLILAHFACYPNGLIRLPAGFIWTPYIRRDRVMDDIKSNSTRKYGQTG